MSFFLYDDDFRCARRNYPGNSVDYISKLEFYLIKDCFQEFILMWLVMSIG